MITDVDIKLIKPNPDNPRVLRDKKFKLLVQSIKDFPQMLQLRPIVVNADFIVLGGNMRLKACKAAGLKQVPVMQANDLTAEQQKEFIVKDNSNFGEWDWDLLANQYDTTMLNDWGVDVWKNVDDVSNEKDYSNFSIDNKLDRFLEAKIKNLTIPFETKEFEDVVIRLEAYLDKYNLVDYKSLIYKALENENL